ncbi:MAG TPA: ABC transporter permease [Acidimicrobiia bacterium]|nr:ABC transporter permease [Acidimicrobiia bacterium]
MTVHTRVPRPPELDQPRWAIWLADHPLAVLGGVLVALVLVTSLIQPSYLSVGGLRNTVLLAAPLGIMAGAQTILMLTGGIDLSVGMIATAAAYVAAHQSPNGSLMAIALGLAVGLLAGAVNGVGVGVFRVNPIIMTLAMSAILVGLFTALSFTVLQGSTTVSEFISTLGGGSFFGNRIPYNALVWAGVSVLIVYTLRRTGFGRLLYAIGDNPVAARLSGVRSWQVLIAAYAIAGLLAALAGILLAGRTGAVDLQLAVSFLLPSVAAAVIGGTSIFGGIGSYSGTILGALILGVLATMLTFLNAGQAIQQIVYGSIVLALAWLYARVTGAS